MSFLSTNLSDKRKALQAEESTKRAQELQHRKELQAAAAAFPVESRNVFEAFKSNFIVDDAGPQLIDGAAVNLSKADEAYWELVFIAPSPVEQAARELRNAINRFNRYERGTRRLRAFSFEGWSSARNRYFNARTSLVVAVKEASSSAR